MEKMKKLKKIITILNIVESFPQNRIQLKINKTNHNDNNKILQMIIQFIFCKPSLSLSLFTKQTEKKLIPICAPTGNLMSDERWVVYFDGRTNVQ